MKRLTPGIWRLLVLSVIALGLLAGGCSSEPPPPPCQPMSEGEIDALAKRESAARTSQTESLAEIDRLREQAQGMETIHQLDQIRSNGAFHRDDAQVPYRALEYAKLSSACEFGLSEVGLAQVGLGEGLNRVVYVWGAVDRMENEVRRAEGEVAEAARAVQVAEVIVRLARQR